MDVELTSRRDDGTWTWRAAGAKQPKGLVDATLLYEGARPGDVVRVEADVQLDGITITSVLPPRDKKDSEPRRLEVLGPQREARPPRPERPQAEQRESRRPPAERPRGQRPQAEREPGRRRPETAEGPDTARRRGPKRLHPGNAHRSAALAALPPEQRPVAEQVLRGGIPAVRQAVETQNAELRKLGQPEVKADALVALAESLLSQLKEAEWRDRAEAAAKSLDDISLRDLRSVVAGADASARHDETRLLASTLRHALERRLAEQRQRWVHDITAALDQDRLVPALRLASRPPDPGARLPGDLAVRMSEAAGAALAPATPPDRWAALLAAVVESPVRRTVKPAGLPEAGGEEVLSAARQACGRIPALAPLLGLDRPPPPGPPGRRPRPPSRPRRQPQPVASAAPEQPRPQ